MKTYLDSEDADIQVELIPLLDVVFCLLAVFILGTVGLTRPEGINLNLPKAESSAPQFGSKLNVKVGILGELLANDQPVNQIQLKQLVSRYISTQPEGVVVLQADGAATYDQVITVLDLLRSVGGERVALETVKSDPAVSPPGQAPSQTPEQDILPVPSVEDPNSGAFPPSAPGQPSSPLPGQPQVPPSSPLPPGLPGSSPDVQPTNPGTP